MAYNFRISPEKFIFVVAHRYSFNQIGFNDNFDSWLTNKFIAALIKRPD